MSTAVRDAVTGDDLRRRLGVAMQALDVATAAINAINVYPVPDGDTGTNMAATLREALAQVDRLEQGSNATEVLETLSRGALFGARGNSGVILSQALRGFAEGFGKDTDSGADALAAALQRASDRAYMSIADPKEGTMLSVLRAAANGASSAAADTSASFDDVLEAAIAEAETAQAATIDQLPELREAGVPDSGGEGICTILRGLRGVMPQQRGAGATVPAGYIHARAHQEQFGFCVEFKLEAAADQEMDLESLREAMLEGGNRSLIVVGDGQLAHVHVHSDEPDATMERAGTFGTVVRPKVEDMAAQAEAFAGQGSDSGVAVLALAYGEGFAELLESTGARVLRIDGTQKPAAGDIARAADACGSAEVIVLSNHRDARLASRQAAELTQASVRVIETTSQPQGIAAALAFNADEDTDTNVADMADAANAVHTVETTVATEDRSVEGIQVRKGDAIALLDGKLVASASSEMDAMLEGLAAGDAGSAELVTVYTGEDTDTEPEAIRDAICQRFAGVEVDVLEGGQSLYGFIASIE